MLLWWQHTDKTNIQEIKYQQNLKWFNLLDYFYYLRLRMMLHNQLYLVFFTVVHVWSQSCVNVSENITFSTRSEGFFVANNAIYSSNIFPTKNKYLNNFDLLFNYVWQCPLSSSDKPHTSKISFAQGLQAILSKCLKTSENGPNVTCLQGGYHSYTLI